MEALDPLVDARARGEGSQQRHQKTMVLVHQIAPVDGAIKIGAGHGSAHGFNPLAMLLFHLLHDRIDHLQTGCAVGLLQQQFVVHSEEASCHPRVRS
jgi:hypothetical protein